nr:MAG TPA: Peptidoglycan endopeptidase [Caudoviricetes sp.]
MNDYKKRIYTIIGGIVLIFCTLYVASSYFQHDVIKDTIRNITTNNRQARQDIDAARSQLGSATKHIDNAEKGINCSQQRLGKVQRGTEDNERKIEQSRTLVRTGRQDVARERKILEEVKRGN